MKVLTSLLVIATSIVASLSLAMDVPKLTFPIKVDKLGYLAGIWDAGSCYVAGQPTEDALRKLAKEGVKTVICFRGHDEMNDRKVVSFDEAALLKELGMNYVHIPLGSPDDYTPAKVEEFAKALGKADGKVLVHCTVGWRASLMWTSYLHQFQKQSLDDSIKAGEAMNMGANRVAALLGVEMTYEEKAHREGSRDPKALKPSTGSAKTITAPKVLIPESKTDHMAFLAWDLGDVINASQPDEAQLKEMAAQGIKTVINIRATQEMDQLKTTTGFDEEAVVKSIGLEYINIPMPGASSFNPENLAKIGNAINNAKGKVLFHCFTANRTSTVWPAFLVKYRGLSLDEAIKHGEAMRFGGPLPRLLGKDIVYKLKSKSTGK
ncbi:MAG: sulfur transferase domain-containing protein [Armatimonadota bacterium]